MKKILMVLVILVIPLSLKAQEKDYYSKEILGDTAKAVILEDSTGIVDTVVGQEPQAPATKP